jgi:hypothetical protein
MKKFVAFAGFALLSVGAFAQTNLQFFYDFGKDRKMVTTTLEMFKGDDWGSTFFFVDYDYFNKDYRNEEVAGVKTHPNTYGARSSYFEIARSFNFWQESSLGALSAHIEFNGGVGFGSRNWLFGAEYFLHNDDFSNTFTFELLYKTFKGSESHLPLQFTFVWGMQNLFGVEGLKFSGFADIWGEDTYLWADMDKCEKSLTFISEPQIWYNVGQFFNCPNLSAGGEVELSYNFAYNEGFMANPCLGLKWEF